MPVVVTAPQIAPTEVFPAPFTLLYYFEDRTIDQHAFIPGEGVTIQAPACTLPVSGYIGTCGTQGELKSEPQPAVKAPQNFLPHYLEVATRCSPPGGPSVEDFKTLTERSLLAALNVEVETELLTQLTAEATPAVFPPFTPLCSIFVAINVAANQPGSGNALIHLPPHVAANGLNGELLKIENGKLTDEFGNLYVVNHSQDPNIVFIENEARYAVYVDEIRHMELPPDAIALRNDRQLRSELAFVLVRSSCEVASVALDILTCS